MAKKNFDNKHNKSSILDIDYTGNHINGQKEFLSKIH